MYCNVPAVSFAVVQTKLPPACFYGSIMTNRMMKVIGLLCLTAMFTVASWMYCKHCRHHVAPNELSTVAQTTKRHAVTLALRDVGILSDKTDCRRLFGEESSAHGFNMSKDFQENIAQFLSAVDNERGWADGHSYERKTQYRFLHYMVTSLKFVHTVCETGMNDLSIDRRRFAMYT